LILGGSMVAVEAPFRGLERLAGYDRAVARALSTI
jgi:hypothetical protein